MSLINDALKRARQSPTPPEPHVPPPPSPGALASPTTPPPPAPPAMRPVQTRPRSAFPSVLWSVFLLAVVAAGVTVIVKGWNVMRQAHWQTPTPVAARPLPSAQEPSQPSPSSAAPATASATQPQVADATATNAPPVTTSEPQPPEFPALRLQGIFFRPANPSAVINAKTVFIGDKIEGVRVTGIERDCVTLEWEGQTKELTLQ